jgi:hypothetical protein
MGALDCGFTAGLFPVVHDGGARNAPVAVWPGTEKGATGCVTGVGESSRGCEPAGIAGRVAVVAETTGASGDCARGCEPVGIAGSIPGVAGG